MGRTHEFQKDETSKTKLNSPMLKKGCIYQEKYVGKIDILSSILFDFQIKHKLPQSTIFFSSWSTFLPEIRISYMIMWNK